ncbi:MAG: creatininase family protein, partial [Candidatus Binatia bacterium]
MMLHLTKLRFPEVESLARSARSLVILPVGAVEEHGAHLPLGLDIFAAEAYAEAAASHLEEKGYTVVLAPAIPYGVAKQAFDFPGSLTLEPDTLRSLVTDIGRSLSKHGLRRQVILNGHREFAHMRALDEAAKTLVEEGTAQVVSVGFTSDPAITNACCAEGIQALSRSPRPDREGHAGEKETSLALYSFPDLVDRKVLRQLGPNFDYDVDALRDEKEKYWVLSSGRGYFGSPGVASTETGRTLVNVRGRNIAGVILKTLG